MKESELVKEEEGTKVETVSKSKKGEPVKGSANGVKEAGKDLATSSDESAASTEESKEEKPLSIYNLKVGQHLTGKVKNITNFGAFVDVGIPQDGLVHISKLTRRKVNKVTDIVSQGEEVEVWVKKVDRKRGRLSLTMIKPVKHRLRDLKEDTDLEGVVTRLESYGAFVDIGSERDGLVHISQITHEYIKHPEEVLKVGDKVNVKVLKVDRRKRQVDLSAKALLEPPPPPPPPPAPPSQKEKFEERRAEMKRKEPRRPTRPRKRQPKRYDIPELENETRPTAMSVAYAALKNREKAEAKSSKESKGEGAPEKS